MAGYSIDRIANGVLLTVNSENRYESFAFRNMNAVIRKIKELENEEGGEDSSVAKVAVEALGE
jgi:hypothetical protein